MFILQPVVSIPFWVFSLLRPLSARAVAAGRACFNPVLGFLPTSTADGVEQYALGNLVSIPFWVFSLLRPESGRGGARIFAEFQSRSGFSPYFDFIGQRRRVGVSMFQSRSGFSPYFDRRCRRERPRSAVSVSIPFWVFSLFRQQTALLLEPADTEFQSRSGFSPYFDRRRAGGLTMPRVQVSIPFWVFSLFRRLTKRRYS